MLNRAARAVTALAAILRHPTVASPLAPGSLLQLVNRRLLGFSAIFLILAQSNAHSPFRCVSARSV
jgi:hypothetical protein